MSMTDPRGDTPTPATATTPAPAPAPAADGIPQATPAPAPDFVPEVEEDGAKENQILAEARRVRDLALAKARDVDWKAAAGIGIGSAALLAALLYAGRHRKGD